MDDWFHKNDGIGDRGERRRRSKNKYHVRLSRIRNMHTHCPCYDTDSGRVRLKDTPTARHRTKHWDTPPARDGRRLQAEVCTARSPYRSGDPRPNVRQFPRRVSCMSCGKTVEWRETPPTRPRWRKGDDWRPMLWALLMSGGQGTCDLCKAKQERERALAA